MAQPQKDQSSSTRAEVVADTLERPALDDRSYRVIRLPNQLEALIIHDPDTDKASAALDVNIGSFSDADDMPGMAHAVEHLLFMGTKKYPVENEYNQYLSTHSGYSNAYTASTSTNYYFEVSAKSAKSVSGGAKASPESPATEVASAKTTSPLYGALDRFAQFFIEPLFLEGTLDRELRAVDSENKKNLQSDTWRLHQLNRSLSNPEHPFCHFSTGNYATLHDEPLKRGVKIRDAFINFYETHYSANRMKLVVLGSESLDELASWVEEFFSDVKDKNLPQNRWDDVPPYTKDELMMQIFAKPVFDMRTLEFWFLYQDEDHLYESQPSRYLSHLIGHEGPGSILAYIKAKGWANGLSAGGFPICPGSDLFSVSVRLTEDGEKNYKEVAKTVFQYIAMLRESPPQQWIIDELIKMSEVDFRFKQKKPASSTTSGLSSVMQKPLPREWLLSGTAKIRKFNPEGISSGLDYLKPDNFRMTIVSQKFQGGWDQKEKWYGTEYKYEPIPEDFREELRKAYQCTASERPQELHMPHKNEFIPTKLEVEKKEVKEPLIEPKLIRRDDGAMAWFKKDDRFWVPKANFYATLRTPLANVTPQTTVLTKLYLELIHDDLVEYAYDAEISGLSYDIESHSLGLDVVVSGYNDKMSVLLEKVLVSLRDLNVREERFKIIKERLLRSYRNWAFQQPYHQVGSISRWLTSTQGWTREQYIDELEQLSADDVRAFYPQLLRQFHVETLTHGNLYKEDALKMTALVESVLKPKKLPPAHWPVRRYLLYPTGSSYVYPQMLKDPANVNHCIEYLLALGSNSDEHIRARALIVGQMTDEPAFDQLRTKEQLGYVVWSGFQIHGDLACYRVLIQSEKTPEYLEKRIDAFLWRFQKTLEDMGEQEFEDHKRSLINKELEKPKNLRQETNQIWGHVVSDRYEYEQVFLDVENIRKLTKADMINFFKSIISPASSTRRKLCVHLLAQAAPDNADGGADTNANGGVTSAADKTSQLVLLLTQIFEASGVSSNSDKLQERLSAIDAANLNVDTLTEAVQTYLTTDASVPADKAQAIITQGMLVMSPMLPSLGIKKSQKDDGGEPIDEGVPKQKEATVIEDVRVWKASLPASGGPTPVKDLSEFEDKAAKL